MKPKTNKNLSLPLTTQREKASGNHQILLPRKKLITILLSALSSRVSCINSLTSPTVLLWTIHDHSHKYLYQLSSRCEQKPIGKKTTYLRKKITWNQNGRPQSEVFDKLVPRLSVYRAKMYAFLVPLVKEPSWRRLNTLGQKQYLAGEVGKIV